MRMNIFFVLDIYFLDAPECTISEEVTYAISVGETIRIPCNMSAHPKILDFVWTIKSRNRTRIISNYTQTAFQSFLTLNLKNKNQYGILYCQARNEIGKQKNPCISRIVEAALPKPVWNCSINNVSSEVIVACLSGASGGLPQVFHMEVITSKEVFNFSNYRTPWFKITNLSPNIRYTLVIYSENSLGVSQSVSYKGIAPSIAEMLASKGKDTYVGLPLVFILTSIGVLAFLMIVVYSGYKFAKGANSDTSIRLVKSSESKEFNFTLRTFHQEEVEIDTGQSAEQELIENNPDVVPLNKFGEFGNDHIIRYYLHSLYTHFFISTWPIKHMKAFFRKY